MSETLPFPASSILKMATSQEGTREHPPGSNEQKYGSALRWNGKPWCAVFLWWCFLQKGADLRQDKWLSIPGVDIASVASLERAAKAVGWWHPGHEGMFPGDLAVRDRTAAEAGDRDHVHMVITAGTKTYKAVGGNESGAVRVQLHEYADVVGFIRPPYKPEKRPHGTRRIVHVVSEGESLYTIARAMYGDPERWPEIYRANRAVIGHHPERVIPGMRLVIP